MSDNPLAVIPTEDLPRAIERAMVYYDTLGFKRPNDLVELRGRTVRVAYARRVIAESIKLLTAEEERRVSAQTTRRHESPPAS